MLGQCKRIRDNILMCVGRGLTFRDECRVRIKACDWSADQIIMRSHWLNLVPCSSLVTMLYINENCREVFSNIVSFLTLHLLEWPSCQCPDLWLVILSFSELSLVNTDKLTIPCSWYDLCFKNDFWFDGYN